MTDNGGVPAEVAEAEERLRSGIAEHIADMQRMVAAEVENRREIERIVNDSRERERRLIKAIAALEGVPLGAGGKPKAAPKPAPKAKWAVSADIADEVYEAAQRMLQETGAPTFSRPQLVTATGRSGETVRRGLNVLREQQRVRLAGKEGKGPTAKNVYALMPEGGEPNGD